MPPERGRNGKARSDIDKHTRVARRPLEAKEKGEAVAPPKETRRSRALEADACTEPEGTGSRARGDLVVIRLPLRRVSRRGLREVLQVVDRRLMVDQVEALQEQGDVDRERLIV